MQAWCTILIMLLSTCHALAEPGIWSRHTTTATINYHSRYVLYGVEYGQDLFHTDLYLHLPLNQRITLWGGGWYGYLSNGTYHEVDLTIGAECQMAAHLSAGLSYTLVNYLEVFLPIDALAHQAQSHLTYAHGPLTLSWRTLYSSESRGYLLRFFATLAQPLSETVSLAIRTEYGYEFQHLTDRNGSTHAEIRLMLPWQMTDTAVIQPFVARSIALETIDAFVGNYTYGGLAIRASF
jgi:hypothetical protein